MNIKIDSINKQFMKKMMMISHNLNLILVITIVIGGSILRRVSSSDFTGTCGKLNLLYPFGFSDFPIRLNCSATKHAKIGEFSVLNVTEDHILVAIPHNCNRKITDMNQLFSEFYAPTWENSFLLEKCNRSTNACSINQTFFEDQLKLKSCNSNESLSCVSLDTNSNSSAKFFSMNDLRNSSCGLLYSSIAFESVGVSAGIALEFERVKLGWWLKGDCKIANCSKNAAHCKDFKTPDGNVGHRCSCPVDHHGDGFITPCRRG